MAHFYGTLQGNRGEVTRTGSKASGLKAAAFGWDIGGSTEVYYSEDLQTDVVSLKLTRNNNKTVDKNLRFAVIDDKVVLLNADFPELLT